MQYWIFFFAGVGGDGFCNLLEKSNNVFSADGINEWKIHKKFGNKVKFIGPQWCNEPMPFRTRVENDNILINKNYKNIIDNNLNTVISTHYEYFKNIKNFVHKDLVEKDQIKIHLYSKNYKQVAENCIIKNEQTHKLDQFMKICKSSIEEQLKNKDYFIHIDVEQSLSDWNYLNENLNKLNINLDKHHWIEYKELINYPNN